MSLFLPCLWQVYFARALKVSSNDNLLWHARPKLVLSPKQLATATCQTSALVFFSKTFGEAQLALALSELGWQLLLGVLLLVGALLVLVLVVAPLLNIKL